MTERSARALSHEAQSLRIKATARRLISERGVAALSLREVAREMEQTSSALYRYFANRDDLITALIIDAYNELGETVERSEAEVPRSSYRKRWFATARGVRQWATANPNEFALLFGTPIPDYEAPREIATASLRVPLVLSGILADYFATYPVDLDPGDDALTARFVDLELMRAFMPGVPAMIIVRAVISWTHLFGHLSFELTGRFSAIITDLEQHYEEMIHIIGDVVGID